MSRKERLPPQGAVQKLNERVKKIGKTNSEIADWLQVQHIGEQLGQIMVDKQAGTPEGRGSICSWPQEACTQAVAGNWTRPRACF